MKIIAVGDLHGKDCWKQIDPSQWDKIVFIGDYVDGSKSNDELIENLQNIIEFKKTYKEKVILLLGNHDIQYLDFPKYECSGYRSDMQAVLGSIFQSNRGHFQVAYQVKSWLFTHAGVSINWHKYFLYRHVPGIRDWQIPLGDALNKIQDSDDQWVLHAVSYHRGGDQLYGGITWADYNETCNNFLPGYHQVVGHTKRNEISTEGNTESSITYIDVLNTMIQFYELNIPIHEEGE